MIKLEFELRLKKIILENDAIMNECLRYEYKRLKAHKSRDMGSSLKTELRVLKLESELE